MSETAPAQSADKKGNNPVSQVQEQLVNQKMIPKSANWDKTIWDGPIKFITSQSATAAAEMGNLAGKVTEVAGGAVNSAQDSLHRAPAVGFQGGFQLPKFGSENWRSRVINKSKAHVGEWLQSQGLSSYAKALQDAEVDGTGLVALHEIWAVDKLGFLKYAQESLKISSPGHALRFGVKLEELPAFLWEDDKQKTEKEVKAEEPKNA